MKRQVLKPMAALLAALCLSTGALAQNDDNRKLAQTGFQFLSVVSDARAAALAGTVAGLEASSSALFFNPATMANSTKFVDASFSLNQWIADINYKAWSLAFQPAGGEYGVFGFSLQAVDYGEIKATIYDASTLLDYRDVGTIEPGAFAVGVGYSKALTDRFSVGGQAKWARQMLVNSFQNTLTGSNTPEVEKAVLAFDFGTYYKTGFRSLAFGFSVRNFSKEIKYVQETFQLPLLFSLGVAMNLVDLTGFNKEKHSVLLSIQSIKERSHVEQVGFGLEYKFSNVLALRGGYITNNDENDMSFGFGLSSLGLKGMSGYGFELDYAYAPFGVFDGVHRFTARFSK